MIVLILLLYSAVLWGIGRFPRQRSWLLAGLHLGLLGLYVGPLVLPLLLLAVIVFYGSRWFYDQPRLVLGLQVLVWLIWLWSAYRLVPYQGVNNLLQIVGGPLLPTLAPVFYCWGLSSFILQLLHYLQLSRQAPGEVYPFRDYLAWLFFLPNLAVGLLADFVPIQTQLQSSVSEPLPSTAWRWGSALLKGALAWALFPWLQVTWEQWLGMGIFDQALTASLSGAVLYLCLSGGADFAIVLGRWVGLNLPENFVYPFAQGQLLGFWGQWQQTLYQRLMALVYVPMARVPYLRWLAFGTMMGLWGLWYGASAYCLLAGLYMGLMLAWGYRQSGRQVEGRPLHWSVYAGACVGVSLLLWPVWLGLGMR